MKLPRVIPALLFVALAAMAQNPVQREYGCQDAGSTDTYACSLAVSPGSYSTGQVYRFKANTANTGAATINFNSIGAATIKKVAGGVTTDLADNDIRAGQWVTMLYDGTNMQMTSQLGNASSGSGTVTSSGSPANHQVAIFTGGTDIKGVGVGATDKPLVGVTGADPAFSRLTLTNPATAATFTLADNKTLVVNNSLTLSGTDSTTMTFPSTTATIARTDAAQTFTGVQTFSTAIAVASGGSGAATLTGLLQGNGTSAFTAITNSTTVGQILRVTGSNAYGWGALDLADTDAVTGVLPNGNTTAASANTASAIVARDGSGNFSAGTITANLTGNASGTAATITGLLTTSNIAKTDVMQTASFCSDAGANDTYTCSTSPAITAYVTGTRYRWKANTANTGTATINFNSVGALTIKKPMGGSITTDLADNDIRAGQWVECIYDGTNCQMATQLGNTPTASGAGTTNDIQWVNGSSLAGGRCTMDSSQNIACTGGVSTGVGGSVAGYAQFGQGTATTPAANTVLLQAPTSVTTAYSMAFPSAAGTGFLLNTDTSNVGAISFVGFSGTGNVARVSSPTFTTPTLGAASATSINGLTITSSTGTFTLANGKTLTVNNSLTLSGTDSTTMTFPGTSQTIPGMNQVNTAGSSMTWDLSASTASNAFKVPVVAGATATANGAFNYDSTNNMIHAAQSGADAKIPQFTVTPANTDCVTWVVSGSNYKLGSAGAACGSASGGNGGFLSYSSPSSLTLGATYYLAPGGGANPNFTEANVQVASPQAATINNFKVTTSVAPGSGNTYVFTWRKAGAATTVTCTISNTATSCSDTTHSFAVGAGDLMSVEMATTGTGNPSPVISMLTGVGISTANGTVNNSANAGRLAYYSSTGTTVDPANAMGAGLAFSSGTLSLDLSTLVNSQTVFDGTQSSRTWTINLSGTDPVWTFSSGVVNLSTGTLQQGGVDVVTLSGTQTLTNKTLTTPVIASISNSGTVTIPAGTDTLVARATADTLTNKVIDAEATGNIITTVTKAWLAAAGGTAAAPYLLWNTLASNAPTATCAAGSTETTLLDCYASFPDTDGDYSLQIPILLPSDWTGNIDVKFLWKAAATSGDAVWQATLVCRADGEVNDAAFNTANTVTDTTKGTANQLNTATISSMTTTGCAAGELATLKVFRNRTHASDTITGAILLEGVEPTMRRAQ